MSIINLKPKSLGVSGLIFCCNQPAVVRQYSKKLWSLQNVFVVKIQMDRFFSFDASRQIIMKRTRLKEYNVQFERVQRTRKCTRIHSLGFVTLWLAVLFWPLRCTYLLTSFHLSQCGILKVSQGIILWSANLREEMALRSVVKHHQSVQTGSHCNLFSDSVPCRPSEQLQNRTQVWGN